MSKFLNIEQTKSHSKDLFDESYKNTNKHRVLSSEAKNVLDAGRELWRYYHLEENININASLYDIKEYFQGRNEKGRMNSKSSDDGYNKLINDLRTKLNTLAKEIEQKVYKYAFLLP